MNNVSTHFLLKGWTDEDIPSLQKLSRLEGTWALLAQDLQQSEAPEKVLQLFPQGLSLISFEVEEEREPLVLVNQQRRQLQSQRLVVLEQFDPDFIDFVCTYLETSYWQMGDIGCFYQKPRAARGWRRAFTINGTDFRHLQTPSRVYDWNWLCDQKPEDLADPVELLLNALKEGLSVVKVEVPEGVKLKRVEPSGMSGYWQQLQLWAMSLLAESENPMRSSIAFALGVFFACTPFYGVQTVLVFAICIVFRLNFPVAFLGAQVSIPPIYGLILVLELIVGLFLLGKPIVLPQGEWFAFAQQHFSAWLLGSAIIGTFLGLLTGMGWYLFVKKWQKRILQR